MLNDCFSAFSKRLGSYSTERTKWGLKGYSGKRQFSVVVVRVVLAFQLFSWRQTKTTAKAAAGPRAVDVTNFWQILFCGKRQWRRRRLPGSSNSVEWGSGLQLHALKAMCRFPLSSSFLQESSVRFSNYYRPSPAKGCSQFRSAYDKVDWFEEGRFSDVFFNVFGSVPLLLPMSKFTGTSIN